MTNHEVGTSEEWLAARSRFINAAALSARGLTAREVEVLERVAAGEADKQIALALGVSIRTVQKHLERIYRKLDAPNRTAALARAGDVAGADGQSNVSHPRPLPIT